MQLSFYERDIIIRALTKVLEIEHPNARADEYKKLLHRLREEHSFGQDLAFHDGFRYDMDDA
ncbi:hypothetical protein [Risungbinella massiliensis]|uniref:hypothetical protein n=1 Tax=Risungbinella massiliensis TaxID=1329796 RepID=UPI0005CBAD19|nr:hypothetical protein [Risungbinella massiliensis]